MEAISSISSHFYRSFFTFYQKTGDNVQFKCVRGTLLITSFYYSFLARFTILVLLLRILFTSLVYLLCHFMCCRVFMRRFLLLLILPFH